MLQFFYEDPSEIQVGIDEAGRGCFAGPVVASSVCWDTEWLISHQHEHPEISIIKDSKKLSSKQRKSCFEFIKANALDYHVSFVSNAEIDSTNILKATYKAMHDSLDHLDVPFEKILVDGNSFESYKNIKPEREMFIIPHVCVTNGDNIYFNIACASILAKVSRDEHIERLCEDNPHYQEYYQWKNNKCYGTKKHIEGIQRHGITPLHRKTFGMCKEYA